MRCKQGPMEQRAAGRRPDRRGAFGLLALFGLCSVAPLGGALGQTAAPQDPPTQTAGSPPQATSGSLPGGHPALLENLSSQSNLFGDMGGLRPWLDERGISFGLNETSELFGNATGGLHTGIAYDGVTMLSAGLDTEKAFGWKGGTLNFSGFWIHGRSLSSDNLAVLQTMTGVEASRTVRLWEAWYDQKLGDSMDIKLGQQSLDQEFMNSTYSALFVNAAAGWPALPANDMYAGGPDYPLSSLGVRLRATAGPFTGLLGVFDDNPPGGPFGNDDQLRLRERSGLAFSLDTGALVIGEVQYATSLPSRGGGEGLDGTYRLGGWFDSGAFPDQRYDDTGASLAATGGDGRLRPHNFSIYAIADQAVWKQAGTPREVGIFVRVMGAPADRNLVSFGSNLGVQVKAPFLSRPNDNFGIEYGIVKISGRASALDHDTRVLTGDPAYPIRSSESFIELTYQAQLTPWWSVQPDLQYVFTPGGGIPNPDNPDGASTPRIGNEAIFGVRTGIVF